MLRCQPRPTSLAATAMPHRNQRPRMWIEDMQQLTETIRCNSQLTLPQASVMHVFYDTIRKPLTSSLTIKHTVYERQGWLSIFTGQTYKGKLRAAQTRKSFGRKFCFLRPVSRKSRSVITEPGKLLLFTFKVEVPNAFADNMIKLSVNKITSVDWLVG